MNHTEYMRIWRANNRERYREITNKACAKWRKNNPDKVKEKQKYDQGRAFGFNRTAVLGRDRVCLHCGAAENLSVDHIDGNRKHNSMDNLQTLCFPCHGHKDGLRGWVHQKDGRAIRSTEVK